MRLRKGNAPAADNSTGDKSSKLKSGNNASCTSVLRRCCWISVSLFAFMGAFILYFLITRMGFGTPFPHQAFDVAPSLLPETSLEVVAELDIPPGNVAVNRQGRIFFNFHPEYAPSPVKIAELINRTSWRPFPSLEYQEEIVTCLSLRIDSKNRLWLLDFAQHGMLGVPSLIGFQLADSSSEKDSFLFKYKFPSDVAGLGSMLNDFQIDPTGEYMYIADTGVISNTPALIVFSIASRRSFRLLDSHRSMFGASVFLNVSGFEMKIGPFGARINVDSIALDRTGSTLFYASVTGTQLYSIPTSPILAYVAEVMSGGGGPSDGEAQRPRPRLEDYITLAAADKPATDGLTTDLAGNIWLTAFAHSALGIAIPDSDISAVPGSTTGSTTQQPPASAARRFKMVKVVQSPRLLRWPDGFSFGPDGLYVTNSALHLKLAGALGGRGDMMKEDAPFHIVRLPAAAMASLSVPERPRGWLSRMPPAGQ